VSLDKRLAVTFTHDRPPTDGLVMLRAEWEPGVPARLSRKAWRKYREGRAMFMALLANAIGGRVLALDYEGAEVAEPARH
jgi:hypothetical protein